MRRTSKKYLTYLASAAARPLWLAANHPPAPHDADRLCCGPRCCGTRRPLAWWLGLAEPAGLELMRASFEPTTADARSCENLALRVACKHGNLSAARWLFATFGLTATDAVAGLRAGLLRTLATGDVQLFEWAFNEVGLAGSELLDACAERVVHGPLSACGCNTFTQCIRIEIRALSWIVERFPLKSLAPILELFLRNLHVDDLAVVRLLVRAHKIHPRIIRRIIRGACALGHITIANWLISHFALGGPRILGGDSELGTQILYMACECAGRARRPRQLNLALADWACDTFALTEDDIRSRLTGYDILAWACEMNIAPLVKWFVQRFGVVCARCCHDVPRTAKSLLEIAYEGGSVAIVQFLTDYLRIRYASLIHKIGGLSLIEIAWNNGRLELVKWISEYYPQSFEEIVRVSHKVPVHNRKAMAAWLRATAKKRVHET